LITVIGKKDNMDFPEAFLQRYRTADSAALKTAVYLMANGSSDEDSLAAELGLSAAAVRRSVDFWTDAGLFGEGTAAPETVAEKPLEKSKRHMRHEEIAVALLGNREIAVLLQETQRLLGRELSSSESRLLVEVSTETGLPTSSILMIESYWKDTEKAKKILTETARTAREWAEKGLTGHDEAEDMLRTMEKRYGYISSAAAVMNKEVSDLTRKEKRQICKIFEEYGYDSSFISEVLLRKPDAGIPYISSVLADWYKKGYRSISDTRLLAPASESSEPVKESKNDKGSLMKRAVKKNREVSK